MAAFLKPFAHPETQQLQWEDIGKTSTFFFDNMAPSSNQSIHALLFQLKPSSLDYNNDDNVCLFISFAAIFRNYRYGQITLQTPI